MAGDRTTEVELPAGAVRWLAAQAHAGENIGESETHVIFVELREPPAGDGKGAGEAQLGPSA